MKWTEPKIMVSIRLPQDLHRAIRTLATSRGVTAEVAYVQALEGWLGLSATDSDAAPDPHVSKLEAILRSGDELAIEAVKQNVNLFHDRLRPKRARPKTAPQL
jgi:hypothetical protein